MLAKTYRQGKIHYPCYVQPKINGLRASYDPSTKRFASREQHLWTPCVVDHLVSNLPPRVNVRLDGEFYRHGMLLQDINSAIGVNRKKPTETTKEIQFHVFDVVADAGQELRLRALNHLIAGGNAEIVPVPSHYVTCDEEADALFDMYVGMGWEGIMYRDKNAPYGFAERCTNKDNRWNYLQKRKRFEDEDGVIVGFKEGKGKNIGKLGSFEVLMPNGEVFNCGGGLTDAQRELYWKEQKFLKGVGIKVRLEEWSADGKPLRGRILLVDRYELST